MADIDVLPSSPEIEQQVISALIAVPEHFQDLCCELDLESFSDRRLQIIYQSICEATVKLGGYNCLTLIDYLEGRDRLEDIGGKDYIFKLFALDTYGNSSLNKLVELLSVYRFKRRLIIAGREIAKLGHDNINDIDAIAEKAKWELDSSLDLHSSNKLELVSSLVSVVEAYVNRGESKGLPTGFNLLDRLIGGFKPAKLYILAARTGMGKTNLAVFFSLQMARASKFPVLFFSAEMSVESLSIRFIANLAKVNSAHINNNFMDSEEQEQYQKGLQEFGNLDLIIDETPANKLDPKTIGLKVRSTIKQHGGIAAVVIDYIQLLGSYSVQRRDLAIGEISRACKDLGKTYKIPFLVLAQVKREVETRANKRPILSDLKDSGQLEQDADAIIFIYRDEYYNKYTDMPNETELIVAKHRDGGMGTIKLEHDLGTCQYKEPKTFAVNLRD